MTDYIRRIVSGNKARFKDHHLNVELDLVYVTDQVIIMGYPASGIEGLYRNRKEDAIKFLEHRHGKNYWVFNFCPIKENSYEASLFGGRVSRYPFPDHHAPPLAVMPLVAREMRAWLSGSPDRVAVLHCKAGKGRSGTMACSYLLSLEDLPTPPKLERSYNAKQWAKRRTESTIDSLPPDEELQHSANATTSTHHQTPLSQLLENQASPLSSDTSGILDGDKGFSQSGMAVSPTMASPPSSANPEKSFTDALKGVLDLHTGRRMKAPSEKDSKEEGNDAKESKVKQGVSIPSQRRFLYYWALLLAHEAPKHMWAADLPPTVGSANASEVAFRRSTAPHPKVRLTQLTLRMRETSSVKLNIVKAANVFIEKTSMAKAPPKNASPSSGSSSSSSSGYADHNTARKEKEKPASSPNQLWASLARYDDGLVDALEEWEVQTRDPQGRMGNRRRGSEHLLRESSEEEELARVFDGGKWDKGKMVRSFARLGVVDAEGEKVVEDKDGKTHVYNLRPLSDKRWAGLQRDLQSVAADQQHPNAISSNAEAAGIPKSESNSMYDVSTAHASTKLDALEQGIVLDAGRELRVKLYMGQVFMGWLWSIPTFHMPQPPPSSGTPPSPENMKSKFLLTRKDVDFPLGIGSGIIDVEIEMEWIVPTNTSTGPDILEPPMRARTDDSGVEPEQTGLATVLQAVVGGSDGGADTVGGVRGVVEAKQGAEG
ncbi:hypothetical protein B0H34DRAFT_681736 [Crassisporium funariophilum]|nr:hypothetical protein B0H34DRAFT_681736 [Crassisporium funariophilum]